MRKFLPVMLIAVLLAPAVAEEKVVKGSREFDLAEVELLKLRIKLPDARLHVQTWKQRKAKITYEIRWEGERPEVEIGKRGDEVFFEVRRKRGFRFFGFSKLLVIAEVLIPEPVETKISVVDGRREVQGMGLSGENVLNLSGVDANLYVRDFTCRKTKVKVVDGEVNVKNLRSDYFKLTGVDGDVICSDLRVNDFYLRTVDGDVRLEGLGSWKGGDWVISTVDGDVYLLLVKDPTRTLKVKAKTTDGKIVINGKNLTLRAKGRVEFFLGKGEKQVFLNISTVDGNIEIKEALK